MEPFSQFSTYHVADPASPTRSEAPACKNCGGVCVVRVSNSAKNPGKEYWACPGTYNSATGRKEYCKQGFNGFLGEPPQKKRAVSAAGSSAAGGLVSEELKKLNQRLDTLVQLLTEMGVTQERILNVLFSESPQSPV